ncbi:uncharacterized protein [Typha angustifolia]|uniref:uncharacterized protein n=1 Tax=Typha angustifolia TaxID=59011 RepID=UPI003C2ACBBD
MKPNTPTAPRSLVSSSPARPEKLPGPSLARLLSRKLASRRRSRSSAMFASRSSRDGAKAEEGEPSSPKVTCIGQVRIKKSNKDKNPRSKAKPVMRCHCLRNPLLCGAFQVRKLKCRPWRRWGFSFGSGGNLQRKSPEKKADCVNSKQEVAIREVGSDHQEIRVQKDETRNFAPSGTTPPPRNALMLMRSRSAPHNREELMHRSNLSCRSLFLE